MNKILLILMLSLPLIFSGCIGSTIGFTGSFTVTACIFPGTAGAPFTVTYPDGFQITGTVNSSNEIKVPPRGYACSQLTPVVGSNFGFALTATPGSVYLPSPPTSGTITGQGFDATYGMPRVEYFDSNGFFVGSVYATSVASGGTSLLANLPDLSTAYTGTYQVKVTNKRSDGYYLNIVGSATISAWGRDRTDSDGDGWYDDEDCSPYDPYVYNNCGGETCGGGGSPGPPYQLPSFCEF